MLRGHASGQRAVPGRDDVAVVLLQEQQQRAPDCPDHPTARRQQYQSVIVRKTRGNVLGHNSRQMAYKKL